MDKKLRLEVLKSKYQIVKDKLLLFSATFGGSIIYLATKTLSIGFLVFFGLGAIVSFIGVLINLILAGKIYKQIEELEYD